MTWPFQHLDVTQQIFHRPNQRILAICSSRTVSCMFKMLLFIKKPVRALFSVDFQTVSFLGQERMTLRNGVRGTLYFSFTSLKVSYFCF